MTTARRTVLSIVGGAACFALAGPTAALAYFGPGAGLSLLGAFWAVLVAVATAVFFIAAWPVRKALRRRRAARARQASAAPGGETDG